MIAVAKILPAHVDRAGDVRRDDALRPVDELGQRRARARAGVDHDLALEERAQRVDPRPAERVAPERPHDVAMLGAEAPGPAAGPLERERLRGLILIVGDGAYEARDAVSDRVAPLTVRHE